MYEVLSPIIDAYIDYAKQRRVQLLYEKAITSKDGTTGGEQEFVVVDVIGVDKEEYIFVVEAKRTSMPLALKQCLLSMMDAQLHNQGGKVYGFITTGEDWRMIEYDGRQFRKSEKVNILFGNMGSEKDRWMETCSVFVDMVFTALSTGGKMMGLLKN